MMGEGSVPSVLGSFSPVPFSPGFALQVPATANSKLYLGFSAYKDDSFLLQLYSFAFQFGKCLKGKRQDECGANFTCSPSLKGHIFLDPAYADCPQCLQTMYCINSVQFLEMFLADALF